MTPVSATLARGAAGRVDAALRRTDEVTASLALLHRVAAVPDIGRVVRVYRPAPTLAFSRREAALPGFDSAVAEASAFGYEPVIRPAGGRAVALDTGWLVVDVVDPEPVRRDNREVFLAYGETFVGLLQGWGVDARLGPVAGEYCPGEYSVNARGRVKIVGTAQRVGRGARLFAASILLHVSDEGAEVLDRVNRLLDLPWRPETLGALDRESAVAPAAIDAAVVAALAGPQPREVGLHDILSAPPPRPH